MEDDSATGFEEVTPDADNAQTEQTTDETAATDQPETQTDQSTDTEATTDLSDDDLAWAKKKGVDLKDEAAVAKMLRNADRKVSEADVKVKTSLQEAVSKTNQPGIDDDVVAELQSKYRALETKVSVAQYYLDNPDDREFDAEASAIIEETLTDDPEFANALGRNLPKLFALAKQRHNEEEVAKAKEEGRKEERKVLAGKQRASATSQAATTSAPGGGKDPFEEGFDNPW